MSDVVHIKAARIPDRDRLLAMLSSRGYDARPLNGVDIDVHGGSDSSPRIYGALEDAVIRRPLKHFLVGDEDLALVAGLGESFLRRDTVSVHVISPHRHLPWDDDVLWRG